MRHFKINITLFILVLGAALPLFAQEPLKVADLEKERQNTLVEIEETNQLLNENKLTIGNALNRMNLLYQRIESREKMISLLNREITNLDAGIAGKEVQIEMLETEIQGKKNSYANAVRKMYIQRNRLNNNLLFIFSAENFTQSIHRVRYLKEYSRWQKRQAGEIIEKQAKINEEKRALQSNKEKKLTLLGGRKNEEERLNEEKSSQKEEIRILEKDKSKLLSELEKKKRQAEALDRQIAKIIAEFKGGDAMTATEKALSSSFAENEGRLPFPLRGNYKIVNYFGVHQYKELSKVTVNNNGIDLETTSGNEARVIFDGVVSRIFVLPGYHNSIIVRHGNYLTLYSYLEQVYVRQGDEVSTGQTLGKIYTDTENGNSTLLHFELWKEQTKLDPLPWLNR
ncbi:peptidase [Bacteroidia bacterium]|nr:peptidase [Bacteroidia bacterium]